jgi:elongation factor P
MATLSHNELRKGVKIEIDGQPYLIVDADFIKPGKGTAFTRVKLKNYITGNTMERTYKANEKAIAADLEVRDCQYLYSDGDSFHFMDTGTYEQFEIRTETMGSTSNWLVENLDVTVLIWKGNPMGVDVPNFIEAEITQCDPGVKGDTAQGGSKPAILSTGASVNVPLFINENDWIRVDTRTGKYVERVKR